MGYFWSIARLTTEQDFHRQRSVDRLQQESTAAANYLLAIGPRMWVNAMIPGGVGRIFGQRTSNAAESMNNSLKSIRSRGILDILMGL